MRATGPTVGTVFTIPTGDGRVVVGQVVATYGSEVLFLAVFGHVFADADADADGLRPKLADVLAGDARFLALSFDAKLHAGHWTYVGNSPVRSDFPLPAYKEAVTTHVDVVDYSGLQRRRATREAAERLPNRTIVSPVRLVKALRASLGLEPWLDAYDALRPPQTTTQDIFGPGTVSKTE